MKRIIYCLFIIAVASQMSCKKDITDLNNNPKLPENVPSATLFTNAEVNLSDQMAHTNVNRNNFRLYVQWWTETTYTDEANYDLDGRSIPDLWWQTFYRDILKDLDQSSKVLESEKTALIVSDAEYKNRNAIIDILKVYSYYTLITTFGNVPFTEALDITGHVQPAYDNASDIFTAISDLLDQALANLDPGSDAFGSADVILNDDISAWIKFGNCLKMRMGLLIADSEPATAKAMVEAAASNVITGNSENLMIHYLAAPPNTNPVWEDLIQSGRKDFIAANTFMDRLLALNDPRIPFFFDKDGDGNYTGGPYGEGGSSYSTPSSIVSNPENPHVYFSYAEMEFDKAEAIERGFNVGEGTAEEHYKNGIYASIEEWGGTSADADTYYAQPGVTYSSAEWKDKIGEQSWIALYNRGYDAWTQWRRLDYPELVAPPEALTDIPVRFTYPVLEQNQNKSNYDAASAAIGGDAVTTKLWFDKN
jgi:Starch-binding associating with outer membrane